MPTIGEVPEWVYQRIIAVGGEAGPRYEVSLYGLTNCLLVSYFPVARQFMVKPQAKIRPEFINDYDPTMRISLDSYHAEVLPRGLGGEIGVGIPDFIVIKASAAKDHDRALLVVEIKPSDRSLDDSLEQLTNYLESFAEKYDHETDEPLFETLYGLLVVGEKVVLITFSLNGEMGSSSLLGIDSAPVHGFLRNIALSSL